MPWYRSSTVRPLENSQKHKEREPYSYELLLDVGNFILVVGGLFCKHVESSLRCLNCIFVVLIKVGLVLVFGVQDDVELLAEVDVLVFLEKLACFFAISDGNITSSDWLREHVLD